MSLLKRDPEEVKRFGEAISQLHDEIHYCKNCHNISDMRLQYLQ
jgi:recombination protein RecR